MSIEQQFTNFNIENFKNNFKSILKSYASTMDELDRLNDYEEDVKKKLRIEKDRLIKQMVSLAIESLKLTDNKREVLDAISKSFLGSFEDLMSDYSVERAYLKEVVLEIFRSSLQK
jgi:uncharacterized protein YsxB (DUF464 family)